VTLAGERELWLMGLVGENPLKVADAGEKNWFSYVEWSPNGSRLLYIKHTSVSGQIKDSMEITNLGSGATTTLMTDNTLRSFIWLRDGGFSM
jgi:Tol biopolymer transport system component